MNGTIGLITGVMAFIFGTISWAAGCSWLMLILIVITCTLGIINWRIHGRAESNKRAATVGFWLGIIGMAEVTWAAASACM